MPGFRVDGRLVYTGCINSIRMSDNLLVPPAPTLNQTPMGLALEPRALELRLLSHRINAGFPSPAADYCEEGLDLNAYLVRNQPATFMFSVKGDSMIHAGIQEGDKVIVDRALTAKHDDIVVAVAAMPTTVALCACTTLPQPTHCPSPPEMLMRPPQALRSLPLQEPLPPITRPATRTPSN